MGSTLSETTLEGATVSEATQSEVKSRKKRFVSLLPLLAVLLMKRPQRESEKTQMDMQSVLTTLLPLSIPFIPSDASMLPVLKELASEEKMVSGVAKRDQPSESKTETDRSKYLSQGLLRMFGPDFIKRPDVSEWLNKEILADFKQFVTDKYSA